MFLIESVFQRFLNKAEKDNIKLTELKNFRAIAGYGVAGEFYEGRIILIGTEKLMADFEIKIADEIKNKKIELENEGKTVAIVADRNNIIGLVAVADTVKETSREAIQKLDKMNISAIMITGDNKRTASAIARQVGIAKVLAEVLPENKASEIKKLQKEGFKVAMVGDGINDAPALAQADLGIAMGGGADIAVEAGGIVLVKNDLKDAVRAIILSKITMSKIKQNMFWALLYNCIGIPIAAGALMPYGLFLKAEFAGLAMALSSVSVVLNSLLLKNEKF